MANDGPHRPGEPLAARSTNELTISHDAFLETAARHGVPTEMAETIWAELAKPVVAAPSGAGLRRERARFAETTRLTRAVKVFLYLGGVLVIGSYGWWADQIEFGAAGLLALSLVYGAAFLGVAVAARRRKLDELVAVAVAIVAFYVPVCAYAALRLGGFDFEYEEDDVAAIYIWIDGGWVWMELAAIAGAVTLYGAFRAPLLALPLSLFTLFLAMDGTARAVGLDADEGDERAIGAFVLAFGLLAVAAGVLLDYRGFRRHAFWPHVWGAVGVVSGAEFLLAAHSFELALILSGAAFLVAGVWLARVGYLVAGGLTLWVGITALAPSPVVLTVSGVALMGVAVWLSLAQSPLRGWLQTRTLPAPQRD